MEDATNTAQIARQQCPSWCIDPHTDLGDLTNLDHGSGTRYDVSLSSQDDYLRIGLEQRHDEPAPRVTVVLPDETQFDVTLTEARSLAEILITAVRRAEGRLDDEG